MPKNSFLCRTACSTRSGFTLVELLVVIGIIAILAGVALGPITNGIKQAQHNAAVQTGRQIGQMFFSYATDNSANGNSYPADTTATAIAQDLLNSNYATDPGVFGIPQQTGYTKATTAGTTSTLDSGGKSVSWCFTTVALNTTGGINANTSDLIPLIYFNNGFQTAPSPFPATPGTAKTVAMAAASPFGLDGDAIFYKGNNALYIKAGTGGAVAGSVNFISANCTDTVTYLVAP